MPAHWHCKRRARWASGLIVLGNVYLRKQGMTAQVLSLGEWLRWERRVAEVLGRKSRLSLDGKGLEVPFVAGETLGESLHGESPLVDKLAALRVAAAALRQLHTNSIERSGTEPWPLSHGDATCHNVIVNLATISAEWIDFDMRHDWWSAVDERHADDLRALLFSSAACLPPSLHAECVKQLLIGYGDDAIVRALRRSLGHRQCPTVFQLAQGPVSYADYFRLRLFVERVDAAVTTKANARTSNRSS